jgi:hypothetical protein
MADALSSELPKVRVTDSLRKRIAAIRARLEGTQVVEVSEAAVLRVILEAGCKEMERKAKRGGR